MQHCGPGSCEQVQLGWQCRCARRCRQWGGSGGAHASALCSVEDEPEAVAMPACAAFREEHARGVLGLIEAGHAAAAMLLGTRSRFASAKARSGGGLTLLPTMRTAALVLSGVPLAVRSMM